MTKEEILNKAQKDNDEMEQAVLTKALGISTIVIPVLCLILIVVRVLNSEYIISDLVTIILAQLATSQLYQAVKMKNKLLFLLGICVLLLTVFFALCFVNEVKI